jgi:hypothetical protein
LIKSKFVFVFDLILKLKHRRIITEYTLEANQIKKMGDLGMKKVILILAIATLLVTVAGTAQAELGWYPVTITYTGLMTTAGDAVMIYADSTNDAWTGSRWFVATSQTKAILATALSAWSMGVPIYLILDSSALISWSPCYGIFTSPTQ